MASKMDLGKNIQTSRQKSVRNFLTYTIIILGILLFAGTFLDSLSLDMFEGYSKQIEQFTDALFYSCIGLLCVVIGFERVLDLSNLEHAMNRQTEILESIDDHISGFRQYKLLETYQDIYNVSIRLIEQSENHIRSVVYANSPKAPDSWNEKVADILKAKSDAGMPAQFDIVINMNPDDFNPTFMEATDKRFKIYQDRGADIYFHRYIQFMEKTIGLDCLIIDNKHLIVSFPTILSNRTQKAILFEHQDDLVEQFINWFNSYAMFEAMSYKTLVKRSKTV